MHEPEPSHAPTGVNVEVPVLQEAVPQIVVLGAWSQVVPLVQAPVLPQVVVTGHVVPQQVPMTQWPLEHAVSPLQEAPLPLVVQPLALQVNGEQDMGVCTQEPEPLHAPTGVNVEAAMLQEAVPQVVVLGATSQEPVLQVPMLQGGFTAQEAAPQQVPMTQWPLVHSVPRLQEAPLPLVVQPLALQVSGAQDMDVWTQAPEPSHFGAGVNVAVAVLQEAEPQIVPLAATSQEPVLQVPMLQGGVTGQEAAPQQMPMTQWPLVHSVPRLQEAPLPLVVQPLALQVNGAHISCGATHVPMPLHVEADVNVAVVVLQEAPAPQLLPLIARSQLPVLHVPVKPQVAMGVHAPLQQMPPTQLLFWHCALVVHGRPFALSEQLPPWQVSGATQSVSAAQIVLHAPVPQA